MREKFKYDHISKKSFLMLVANKDFLRLKGAGFISDVISGGPPNGRGLFVTSYVATS